MNTKKELFAANGKRALAVFLIFMLGTAQLPAGILPEQSPYTYIPEGRPIDTQEFHKPQQMADIVPNRPVVAHDKNGNRLYFSPSGKLSLRISNDGKMEFSLKKRSVERDAKGKILGTTEVIDNTGKTVRKNAKGQVMGYSEFAFGGKSKAEYDSEGNLTKSYHYNRYGKSTEYILDEMSRSKTMFNDKGQMAADVDYEKNEVAWYHYDDKNRLSCKVDGYGNTTYFNKENEMIYTKDFNGVLTNRYHYKTDDEGRKSLDYVEDVITGNKTWHGEDANGLTRITKDSEGNVVKDFSFDGQRLVYTFDREKNETTWYDINEKPLYTSYNDTMIREWLYYKGKLVGMWEQSTNSIVVYKNQRDEIKIQNEGEKPPSAEQIEKWVQEGLIEDMQDAYKEYYESKPWDNQPEMKDEMPKLDYSY